MACNDTRKAVLELGSGVGVGGISAALAGAAHVTLSDLCGDEERSSSLGRASPPTRAGTACPRVRRCERSASQYSYSFAFLRPLSGVPARMASLDWDECLSADFEPARRPRLAGELLWGAACRPSGQL
mmetsp:Transcript_37369/g.111178  ORF Transcript_37369/g.111178 Transcript_37369/m.111178 type:complete len:128 (-) Transcript_37369:273-656(-)